MSLADTVRSPLTRRPFSLRKLESLARLAGESIFHPITGTSVRPPLVPSNQLGITFIGHSSFFLQIGGRNLLIDPVFAHRLIVLRRHRRPGVLIRHLPAIDLVLLTHAHMDHLNRPSLVRIVRHTRRLRGRGPIAVVPRGVGDLVEGLGFRQVIEMEEWWEARLISGLRITFTPAKHWGARLFKDVHRAYGGYVIESDEHSVYHSGDSAYFNGFSQIGKRLAPRVALLPIGAYSPDNYLSVHTNPEQALNAFVDLGAERMIPMHYGTFRLSREPMHEPVERLMAAASNAGVLGSISVLGEGETEIMTAGREEVEPFESMAVAH